MHKKTIISFFLIFVFQFIFGCFLCNCPQPKGISFDFDAIIFNKKLTKPNAKNEIAFAVTLVDSSKVNALNNKIGSFMSQAMACSCSNEYGVLKSNIKALQIITKFDFNNLYKAGSDISELFVANSNNLDYPYELHKSLPNIANELNDRNYGIFFGHFISVEHNLNFFYKSLTPTKKKYSIYSES